MTNVRMYLAPDSGQGLVGGAAFEGFGTPMAPVAPVPPVVPFVITPGVAAVPPTAEQIAADETRLEELTSKEESLTEVEKTELANIQSKYDLKTVREDGTEYTPEELKKIEDDIKKVDLIRAKPEDQRTIAEIKFLNDNSIEAITDLYSQVDELTGNDLGIDYGDLKANTPEWVARREETIADRAMENYDKQLKNDFPLAYQLLLHQQAGGKVEDFLKVNTQDYTSVVLSREDKGTQEMIYRQALAVRGNTQEQVDALIQVAKDKGKLFENSEAELKKLQAGQKSEMAQNEQRIRAAKAVETQVIQNFSTSFNGMLDKGFAGIKVPQAQKAGFNDFIGSQVFVRDGKLIQYKELDSKDLENEIAAQYFKFMKGDLTKVVERRANSIVANQLKNRVKQKLVPKSSNMQQSKIVPMAEV